MKINFFRLEIENNVSMLMHYQKTMEKQLIDLQKEQKADIEKILNENQNEEEHYEEDNLMEGFHDTYEITYPRLFRYAFVVLLYLNLESMLNKFCESVQKKYQITEGYNNKRGFSINSIKKYLHEVVKVKNINISHWNNVMDLSFVRNCIVHTNGNVSQSRNSDRLNEISNMNIGLSIHDGLITFTDDYCAKRIKDVSDLINELFEIAGYDPSIVIKIH